MDETSPLRLPVQHDLDDLSRAIAALTDQVGKLGQAEERTQQETAKAATTLQQLQEGADNVRSGFKDAWEELETWSSRIGAVVEGVASLATEQDRLDTNSARLRLDFDEGAAAAGRFADETEAMGAATRFAAAQSALSQQELNALMRVAGATSQMLGITTAQAVDRLTQGMISGAREGLQPFGAELVALAGSSHSVDERLQALVRVAGRTAQATDSASDSVARFRDSLEDTQRTIATSFVREMQRLSDLGAPFRGGAQDAEEFNRQLQAVGQTAARLASQVGNGIGAVGATVATGFSLIGEVVGLSDRDTTNQLANFARARARALNVLADEGEQRRSEGSSTTDPARIDLNLATPEIIAAVNAQNEAQRAAEAQAGRATRTGGGPRSGQRRDPNEALRQRVEDENAILEQDRREQEQRAAEEERIAKSRAEQEQRQMDQRREAQERARERDRQLAEQQWAQSDPGLRAANDNDRTQRNEQRALDLRRQNLRSFTDFFEEQHQRQIVSAREMSDAVTGALSAVGSAYAKHLTALVQGREEGGVAVRGFLSDTLLAIGQESATKAGFNLAEGVAALATYRYDAAAQHFAAFGIYTAVAAGTGAAGAALAPSSSAGASAGGAAASGASSRPSDRMRSANDNASDGSGVTVIEQHYYAPIIGGREATSAETGRGVERFTRAADRRRLGRTGTGG